MTHAISRASPAPPPPPQPPRRCVGLGGTSRITFTYVYINIYVDIYTYIYCVSLFKIIRIITGHGSKRFIEAI